MTVAASRERLAELLRPAALQFQGELSGASLEALARYADLLLAWNQRINLSGARDLHALATEHIADAFALLPHLPASGPCVDVGSGGGLPGLVLAVLRPDLAFTLLEPIEKRRSFLAAAVREMGLGNVAMSGERVEAHLRASAGGYAFAVARAVWPLAAWFPIGARLVRADGVVAGLAGGTPDAAPPGAKVHRYDVGAGPRAVVIVVRK